MRNDLQYDLCPGCGEISPKEGGILARINHSCALNTFTYTGATSFKIRHLTNLFYGIDEMQSFKKLLHFDTFNKMPDYKTASDLDKKIFSICRDADVKTMKRLRAYIELEEQLNSKY